MQSFTDLFSLTELFMDNNTLFPLPDFKLSATFPQPSESLALAPVGAGMAPRLLGGTHESKAEVKLNKLSEPKLTELLSTSRFLSELDFPELTLKTDDIISIANSLKYTRILNFSKVNWDYENFPCERFNRLSASNWGFAEFLADGLTENSVLEQLHLPNLRSLQVDTLAKLLHRKPQLQVLNLKNSSLNCWYISAESWAALEKCFQEMPSLHSVKLSYSNKLLPLLKHNPKLKSLDLSGFQTDDVKEIVAIIENNRELKSLDLSDTMIPTAELIKILKAIRGFCAKKPLDYLGLGGYSHFHTFQEASELAAELPPDFPVKKLELGCEMVEENTMSLLGKKLICLKALTKLKVTDRDLRDNNGKAFFTGLPETNIEELEFIRCKIDLENLQSLCDWLAEIKTTKKPTLKRLSFVNCRFNNPELSAIAIMLNANRTLEYLDLSNNNNDQESGSDWKLLLKNALRVTAVLRELNLSTCRVFKFSDVLPEKQTSLRTLHWKGGYVEGEENARFLGGWLQRNPLEKLELKDVEFTPSELSILGKALSTNTTLTSLELGAFDDRLDTFYNSLQGNTTLREIKLFPEPKLKPKSSEESYLPRFCVMRSDSAVVRPSFDYSSLHSIPPSIFYTVDLTEFDNNSTLKGFYYQLLAQENFWKGRFELYKKLLPFLHRDLAFLVLSYCNIDKVLFPMQKEKNESTQVSSSSIVQAEENNCVFLIMLIMFLSLRASPTSLIQMQVNPTIFISYQTNDLLPTRPTATVEEVLPNAVISKNIGATLWVEQRVKWDKSETPIMLSIHRQLELC